MRKEIIKMDSKLLRDLVKKAYSALQDTLNLPSLNSLKNLDWTDIGSTLATIGGWIILIAFSALVLWIIRAIGLYKMAKDKDDKYAFLAFVPYGGTFIMGRIIGKTRLFGIEITYPEFLLPLLLGTMLVPGGAPLSSILFVFFYYGILYRLYKLKWKGFATVATIISLFVPVLQPIFIFFIRNL